MLSAVVTRCSSQTLAAALSFLRGLCAAFGVCLTCKRVYASQSVCILFRHCLSLNLCNLLSICLYDLLLVPLLRLILVWNEDGWLGKGALTMPLNESLVTETPSGLGLLDWCQFLLWRSPMTIVCLLFNMFFYQDIVRGLFTKEARHDDETTGLHDDSGAVVTNVLKKLNPWQQWERALYLGAEEVFRVALTSTLLVQMGLLNLALSWTVSLFGISYDLIATIRWLICALLYGVHTSVYYAMYAFEYRWSQEGASLKQRLERIEGQWAFFCGFGLLPMMIELWIPARYAGAVIACLLPVLISQAIVKAPRMSVRPTTSSQTRLPLFGGIRWFWNVLLPFVQQRCCSSPARKV
jgi:hypothetical protein